MRFEIAALAAISSIGKVTGDRDGPNLRHVSQSVFPKEKDADTTPSTDSGAQNVDAEIETVVSEEKELRNSPLSGSILENWSLSSDSDSEDQDFEFCGVGILDGVCSSKDDICIPLDQFEETYGYHLSTYEIGEEEREGIGVCVYSDFHEFYPYPENDNNGNDDYNYNGPYLLAAPSLQDSMFPEIEEPAVVKSPFDVQYQPPLVRQRRLGEDCNTFCSNYQQAKITETGEEFRMLVYSCIDPRAAGVDCPHLYTPWTCWDVSSVINMARAFQYRMFNEPIDCWDTSNVTNMRQMFNKAYYFNQLIDAWDVSKVVTFNGMFKDAPRFNKPLGSWNTGRAMDMSQMFHKTYSFNQNIDNWDTSNVVLMPSMLSGIYFNNPLSKWNVGKVKNMRGMFYDSFLFNQNLNDWDVSGVNYMDDMFNMAQMFDQCLSSWGTKASDSATVSNIFYFSGCPATEDPDPSVSGPWCRSFQDSCGEKPRKPCENLVSFKAGSMTITCSSLNSLPKKDVKTYCKKYAKLACPATCDSRCTCKDKKKFKIKKNKFSIFAGKFKCKNVGKTDQPKCTDRISNGSTLVKAQCVKKCGYCHND